MKYKIIEFGENDPRYEMNNGSECKEGICLIGKEFECEKPLREWPNGWQHTNEFIHIGGRRFLFHQVKLQELK